MPNNSTPKSDEAHCSGNIAGSVGVSDGEGDVARTSNELEKAMREPDDSASAEDDEMVLTYSEAERFITFTDAVVAIAMTLLILPLMEAASDIVEENMDEGGGEGE